MPKVWNPSFTERDKVEYTELYVYIQQYHTEIIADIMAQMIIYKKKYHLKYSEEQEAKIAALFTRIESVGFAQQGLFTR